ERQHLAFHLAGSLAVGESCPVCLQPVLEIPSHAEPVELSTAKSELKKLQDEAQGASTARDKAAHDLVAAQTEEQGVERQIASLREELRDAPDIEQLLEEMRTVGKAKELAATARREAQLVRDIAIQKGQAE